MDNFRLHLPVTIFFGANEFERVKKAARETGKRALIVIGGGSVKKNGYLNKLERYLDEEKISHEVFEGIEPNPRSATINKAGVHARKMNADMIIALGGGSVMDASKGVAIVAKSGDDIWDYLSVRDRKPRKVSDALPIIAIPTLAATGSEINGGAVITNEELKLKAVIHCDKVIPKFAIIDPVLTMSVPTDYVVDGAVDIICHSIETYLSNKNDFALPDYLTLGIIRTVKNAIEKILEDPKDVSPRENLSWSSSVAMMQILSGRNGGWPIHLIEHGISAIYDISHGLGLSLLLPAILRFNKEHNPKRINKMIGFLLHENTNHYTDVDKAIVDLTTWLNSIGALRDLKKAGIKNIDVDTITKAILDTSGSGDDGKEYIYGVVPMYKDDIKAVLKDALRPLL